MFSSFSGPITWGKGVLARDYIIETDFTYGPGVVTEETDVPFPGAKAIEFSPSTEDYIFAPVNDDYSPDNGDFTIEWWSKQYTTASWQRVFVMGNYSGAQTPVQFGCTIENGTFYYWTMGSPKSIGNVGAVNTWIHWAIVRTGSTVRVYKNGILFGSTVDGNNISSNYDFYIGATNARYANEAFNGLITNMRLVKGVAVYTGAFNVPTSNLTAVAPANPYGGSNTVAIPEGATKLLFVPQ